MRSEMGSRPNSPCQMIKVESNRPRLRRSLMSPAIGLSVSQQGCSWFPLRSQCASQLGSKYAGVVFLRNGIEFVIVATGASDSHPHKRNPGCGDFIMELVLVVAL